MAILQDYSAEKKFILTIITPLYNRLTFFENWLKSLLLQEHHDATEVLLINDGSTSFNRADLETILQAYQAQINQHSYTFHYLENKQNLGQYKTINKAAELANGSWIYILPDDDVMLKNTLLEFLAIIKEFPQVELMTGRFYNIDEQGKIIEKSPELAPEGFIDQHFRDLFLITNPLHAVCTMYHKNIWQKYGGLNPQLDDGGDWELLRRLTQAPLNWYYIPRYLCGYRIHPAQKTSQFLNHLAGKHLWQILELGKKYYEPAAVQQSKIYQYQHLFKWVDHYFEAGQFAQGSAILLDIVKFSDLGDRLWLTTLEKMSIDHKSMIRQTIEVMINKPYLSDAAIASRKLP